MKPSSLLQDAVQGCSIPYSLVDELTERGLVRFVGNQHNPGWSWEYAKLADLSHEEIKALYRRLKNPPPEKPAKVSEPMSKEELGEWFARRFDDVYASVWSGSKARL